MDTKKLIIAIALSIIVITLYQYLFMPKPEVKPTRIKDQKPERVETVPSKTQTETAPKDISEIFSGKEKEEKVVEKETLPIEDDLKDGITKDIIVETDLFRVTFTNKGAGMKSFILKKYNDDSGQPLELVSKKVEKFGLLPFYFSPFEGDEVFRFLNNENFLYSGDLNLAVGKNSERELVFKYADKAKNLFVSSNTPRLTDNFHPFLLKFNHENLPTIQIPNIYLTLSSNHCLPLSGSRRIFAPCP